VPDQSPIQAFADRHPRLMWLVFFVVGALLVLSFAPFGLYQLAPLLLLPVLYSCLVSSAKVAARHCFWFGCGLFLAGTYWLYVSIHVFGQAPLWIAIFLMVGLVIVMGLYYAATGWLINHLSAGKVHRLLLAAPAAWVLVEWFRGWFLSGFPWMSLGYAQIDSPLSGLAPLIGVYGVSALPVFSAADKKWLPAQFRPTLELYRAAAFDDGDHELMVWPEVAIPAAMDQVDGYLQALQSALRVRKQTLVLGILERNSQESRIYNSVLMLDGRTRQIYRKRHLVPFGEVFPVPDFVRDWMRLMSLPHSDINAGAAEQPLLVTAGGQRLVVAVCYEDAYGAEQLYALPEASILINVSNDAWFGDSIAPHQHLEIARMRALEVGRSVVRATNNGVSAFIGPQGELLQSGPQFEFVSMTRDVVPMGGLTPYARWGNWPVVLAASAILAGCGWLRRRGAVP
jgi:apolipoprotein N-acyltransferase